MLLSGLLDDGVAGLAEIKRFGGRIVVQDPEDAVFGDMPRAALAHIEADAVVAADGLVDVLDHLIRDLRTTATTTRSPDLESEPSRYTCPDCGGVLEESSFGSFARWRCRTGHEYSVGSYIGRQSDVLENALFVALRTLDEREDFCRRLARQMRVRNVTVSAERMEAEASEAHERAAIIRAALQTPQMLSRDAELRRTAEIDGG